MADVPPARAPFSFVAALGLIVGVAAAVGTFLALAEPLGGMAVACVPLLIGAFAARDRERALGAMAVGVISAAWVVGLGVVGSWELDIVKSGFECGCGAGIAYVVFPPMAALAGSAGTWIAWHLGPLLGRFGVHAARLFGHLGIASVILLAAYVASTLHRPSRNEWATSLPVIAELAPGQSPEEVAGVRLVDACSGDVARCESATLPPTRIMLRADEASNRLVATTDHGVIGAYAFYPPADGATARAARPVDVTAHDVADRISMADALWAPLLVAALGAALVIATHIAAHRRARAAPPREGVLEESGWIAFDDGTAVRAAASTKLPAPGPVVVWGARAEATDAASYRTEARQALRVVAGSAAAWRDVQHRSDLRKLVAGATLIGVGLAPVAMAVSAGLLA